MEAPPAVRRKGLPKDFDSAISNVESRVVNASLSSKWHELKNRPQTWPPLDIHEALGKMLDVLVEAKRGGDKQTPEGFESMRKLKTSNLS